MVQNKGIIFKKVPSGWPVPGQDLAIEDRHFDLQTNPPAGGITVKNYYASFDPYQRGRMRPADVKSYSAPFELGKPITNRSISKVVKSDSSKFKPGDLVISSDVTPIEEYSVLSKEWVEKARKLENPYNLDPKIFLGALGMPGLTAYSSFYEIGKPKKGETIFISAASGAVGQLVGQLAKHEGLKVIGSVGDDKKLDFIIKELGFDSGFNYKTEKAAEALPKLAPQGIDIYYENVGGEQLEAAINNMNLFGRIIACGMVSQYNLRPEELYPFRNLMQIVGKRLNIQGFIVGDANMGPRYAKEHQEKLQKWIADGTFKAQQSVTVGIDNGIDGFLGMLSGKNFGKAVLQIADLEADK
ncbi:NADP-dependent leukotriene B4 12-hydroxydehydrogenase [Lindgomyces ingoldianus]|uniref:NADP-dependent leukotriene B4 12-hydroxydehydrogenase n=1 Tax=Lindgomyces ingoldianus TaxID=673940 RepID=A0ACB6RAL1_9PLEO|nr:NADP-dependent leukotriene B4 12-hydroxydehydrogenase [Lindgomyces ingoldianus]KAF2476132.1 NADP-dependent leukotriene B4 12-hydroxydehydrogenase [Lindgomyces ingoldianus]